MDNGLAFDLEADEVEIFLQDVNEHLQVMEAGILRLEQAQRRLEEDPATLNAVFRAAHTLKAVAATVGHQQMAELTHTMETLFDAMREGVLLPTPAITDALLHALDILNILRDEVVSLNASGVDVNAVLRQLQEILEGQSKTSIPPKQPEAVLSASPHTPVEFRRELTPEQIAEMRQYLERSESLEEGGAERGALTNVLQIEVVASADAFAPAARLLQAALLLKEVGHVIAQYPSQADLVNDQHQGSVWAVLASSSDPHVIEELLGDIADLTEVSVRFCPSISGVASDTPRPSEDVSFNEGGADEERAPLPDNSERVDALAETSLKGQKKRPNALTVIEESMVRISVSRLDTLMNLVGELITDRTRLIQVENVLRVQYNDLRFRQRSGPPSNDGAPSPESASLLEGVMSSGGALSNLRETINHFNRVLDQLQEEVMLARMLPIAQLFNKFPRLVRDVARVAGKQVNLIVEGEMTELDRSIIEAIGDPLTHLLRNAVDHGVESPQARIEAGKPPTGKVRLAAEHAEGHIVITVQDDGRGIDLERVRQVAVDRGMLSKEEAARLDDDKAIALIFQPNLSTADQVTDVSGRGVGLDVVQTNVKRLGGSVAVESDVRQGTTFRLMLPLTLAILQTMLVALGDDVYAIPLTSIIESIYLSDVTVNNVKGNPMTRWRNQALPLVDLRKFFDLDRDSSVVEGQRPAIVIVAWGKLRVGLIVDKLIGKEEIVVKSLSPLVGNVTGVSGCTILGDGRVALIVDVPGLVSALSVNVMRGHEGVVV